MTSPEQDLLTLLAHVEEALRDAGQHVDADTDLAAAVRELTHARDAALVALYERTRQPDDLPADFVGDVIFREHGPNRLIKLDWTRHGRGTVLTSPTLLESIVDELNEHRTEHPGSAGDGARPYTDEERAEHPATFTIRPAGEHEDVTVALHDLGPCTICGHGIGAGAFAVEVDTGGDGPPFPKAWAHESCARPQNPARPALNAEQTRNRS